MRHVGSCHSFFGRRGRLLAGLALGGALLLCLVASASARPGSDAASRAIFDLGATPSWTLAVAGPGSWDDLANDVKITSAGVTYVAGEIGSASHGRDVSLVKIVHGIAVWAQPKRYDSPFHKNDGAENLALGPGNVIYTAGYAQSANGGVDMLLVKWSSNGKVLWARRYDGPVHGYDEATGVGVDAAGNVTVAGVSAGAGGYLDGVLLSWTSSGVRRWKWRYDGVFHGKDALQDMLVAGNGSIYATGYTTISASKIVALTVRLSSSGKKLWSHTYAGPAGLGAMAMAIAARPGGGVYVAGDTNTPAAGTDGMVVRYTASGGRTLFTLDGGAGGTTDQFFGDVAVASTRQVVAVGSDDAHGRQVAYNTNGAIAGAFTFPGVGPDSLRAVATDAFGGYYVAGSETVAPGNVKVLSGRGSLLTGGGGWLSLWGPVNITDGVMPVAIAVRGTTAVVVGADYAGVATGWDQFVLGYIY